MNQDLRDLLHRAAAALETPSDLTDRDLVCLIEDLREEAGDNKENPDTPPILMKTTIVMEVLHEPEDLERIVGMDLEDICFEVCEGDWSGKESVLGTENFYTREAADAAIVAQGSDPGFFFGDEG